MDFIQSIAAFIVVIGVVVVVHELGHFLAARSVGIRVERFSIGYPPRMIGKKIGDTDYCISWLPLGGYVKMAGMIDESLDNPEQITGSSDEFMSKNVFQKILVICAGVMMNFILAAAIYTGVTLVDGIPEAINPVVESVSPGFPAEEAGIEPGDRFVEIDGSPIELWEELVAVIHTSPDKPLRLVWEREGERFEAEVTPDRKKIPIDGEMKEVGLIGITPRATFRPAGIGESLTAGVTLTGRYLGLGVTTIKMLVTGQAGIKDLGGPVLIAKWSGDSAKAGSSSFILFIAFISINIGLLNILPIPVLDGGHLVLIVIEGVARRPISTRIKVWIQQVGMIGLLGLMAVIIFNDLGRIEVFEKIKNLF